MKRTFLVVLILSFAFAAPAFAEDAIQPFGSLLWTDSFFEVIQKINALETDKLLLRISNASVDIKGADDKDALCGKLGEVLEKYSPRHFNPKWKSRIEKKLGKYKDSKGTEQLYLEKDYLVFASPVTISGVPFKLEAVFCTSPELASHKPGSILVEDRMGYAFPLMLKEVTLRSTSPSLSEKHKEINAILDEKYKKYDPDNKSLRWPRGGQISDGKGSTITISSNTKSYSITYKSDAYPNELKEKYGKQPSNQADQEANKTKQTKDIGSDL